MPVFTILAKYCKKHEYYVIQKCFELTAIMYYQGVIFLAQYQQMNEEPKEKMNGINTWFLIEIFSFYGYIISAIILSIKHSLLSTFGLLERDDEIDEIEDLRTYGKNDWLENNRANVEWSAMILIMLCTNTGLILIDSKIYG